MKIENSLEWLQQKLIETQKITFCGIICSTWDFLASYFYTSNQAQGNIKNKIYLELLSTILVLSLKKAGTVTVQIILFE